jgi:hypothetical protein
MTTQEQLAYVRTQPHRTKLWLSIYKPSTALACQVNNAGIAKGARTIQIDGITEGSAALVNNGMTMYVGSQPGYSDYGFPIRVKSVALTTGTYNIEVAENSYDWYDNSYLTVVNFYEIQAVFPRIISNPADPTKTIWYKDYDIAYTNQNTVLGAYPCMGSHYAGFLESGTGTVYYSATGTYHVAGDDLTYDWFFEGATVTGSALYTPGYISYNAPGHYTTRLTVTNVSGTSTDTSYRHISIYDRPENGTNVPILSWQLTRLSGSKSSGGYSAGIKISQSVPETQIHDGSLVVIFADEWYGSKKVSIGGNQENRNTIVFVGYITDGSIQYNYRDKTIEFEVTSPTGMMKLSEGFSISVEDNNDPLGQATSEPGHFPSPWMLLKQMTVNKAIWHYLKWHTTVLKCVDVQFTAGDEKIQYFDASRTNMHSAIETLMKGALLGNVISDAQGKIWMGDEVYVSPPVSSNNLIINDDDWFGDPTIDERQIDAVSYIEGGGIAYTGFTGTSTPLLSCAPGSAPGYRGTVERFQGLALSNQTDLNTTIGRLYAYRNSRYPRLDLNLAGNYRILDVAPQDKYTISISANKNPRGIAISKDFHIDSINWNYNPKDETFYPGVSFAHLGESTVVAETIVIPPIPPTEGGGGGFTIPSINIPPFSIPPISLVGQNADFYPAYAIEEDGSTVDTWRNGAGHGSFGVRLYNNKSYYYNMMFFGSSLNGAVNFSPVFSIAHLGSMAVSLTNASIILEVMNENAAISTSDVDSLTYTYNSGTLPIADVTFPINPSLGVEIYVVKSFAYSVVLSKNKGISFSMRFTLSSTAVGQDFLGVVVNYL